MQDVWMWSSDPKDPKWRIRIIEERVEVGLVDIIEENTTSTADTAQPTEALARISLTPADTWRLLALLAQVVGRMPRLDGDVGELCSRSSEMSFADAIAFVSLLAFGNRTAPHFDAQAFANALAGLLCDVAAVANLADEGPLVPALRALRTERG